MYFRYGLGRNSVFGELSDTRGLRRRSKASGRAKSGAEMILSKYRRSRQSLHKDITELQ